MHPRCTCYFGSGERDTCAGSHRHTATRSLAVLMLQFRSMCIQLYIRTTTVRENSETTWSAIYRTSQTVHYQNVRNAGRTATSFVDSIVTRFSRSKVLNFCLIWVAKHNIDVPRPLYTQHSKIMRCAIMCTAVPSFKPLRCTIINDSPWLLEKSSWPRAV